MAMENIVNVKQCKKCDFYLRGFHNVFGDRPTKWPIAKKKPT
jgi:hypothetical protein